MRPQNDWGTSMSIDFFLCACEGTDHSGLNVIVLGKVLGVAWFGLYVYSRTSLRVLELTVLY